MGKREAYRKGLAKSFNIDLAAAPRKALFLQNLCEESYSLILNLLARCMKCSGVSRVLNEDEDFLAQMWKPINIQLMQHKFYGVASKNDHVLI